MAAGDTAVLQEEAPVSTRGLVRELLGLQMAQGCSWGSGAARIQLRARVQVGYCSGMFQDCDCGAARAAHTLAHLLGRWSLLTVVCSSLPTLGSEQVHPGAAQTGRPGHPLTAWGVLPSRWAPPPRSFLFTTHQGPQAYLLTPGPSPCTWGTWGGLLLGQIRRAPPAGPVTRRRLAPSLWGKGCHW